MTWLIGKGAGKTCASVVMLTSSLVTESFVAICFVPYMGCPMCSVKVVSGSGGLSDGQKTAYATLCPTGTDHRHQWWLHLTYGLR